MACYDFHRAEQAKLVPVRVSVCRPVVFAVSAVVKVHGGVQLVSAVIKESNKLLEQPSFIN